MRVVSVGFLCSLPFLMPAALASPGPGKVPDPAPAVSRAIEALDRGKPNLLKPLLPEGSKVHLSLTSIGPARGLHGRGQLIVLLEQFFFRCAPAGFSDTRSDGGTGGTPVSVHGTLSCKTREGPVTVTLHMTLELSGGSWRLSEVWETG